LTLMPIYRSCLTCEIILSYKTRLCMESHFFHLHPHQCKSKAVPLRHAYSGERSALRPGRTLSPGREPSVPIGWEAGWASELVWEQRLEEKSSDSAGDQTPVVQSVVSTTLSELRQLLHI
jgi:hypothetical protein